MHEIDSDQTWTEERQGKQQRATAALEGRGGRGEGESRLGPRPSKQAGPKCLVGQGGQGGVQSLCEQGRRVVTQSRGTAASMWWTG